MKAVLLAGGSGSRPVEETVREHETRTDRGLFVFEPQVPDHINSLAECGTPPRGHFDAVYHKPLDRAGASNIKQQAPTPR